MKTVIHWPQFILMIVLTLLPAPIVGLLVQNLFISAVVGMIIGVLFPLVFMAFVDVWHFEDERGRRI